MINFIRFTRCIDDSLFKRTRILYIYKSFKVLNRFSSFFNDKIGGKNGKYLYATRNIVRVVYFPTRIVV